MARKKKENMTAKDIGKLKYPDLVEYIGWATGQVNSASVDPETKDKYLNILAIAKGLQKKAYVSR